MPNQPDFTDEKTRLDGQVAVVTVRSQGNGRSIAQLLTARGAQVISWDRQLPSKNDKADFKPTWEYSLEDWDRVVAIDMTSVFYTSRLVAAHMRALCYGRIVTISFMAGKEGVLNLCAYYAVKAGVIGFSKALSKEVCENGVTVNCIAPAMTDTPLLDGMTDEHIKNMKAKIPIGRLAKVNEVAELAAWIASSACSFTTGFVFDLIGGRATY